MNTELVNDVILMKVVLVMNGAGDFTGKYFIVIFEGI